MGKGTNKLPSPTFDGIVYIEDRPHARISIVGAGVICLQTADVDWLAELASVSKNACAALITERARGAQALALHINEEINGDPEASGQARTSHPGGRPAATAPRGPVVRP